MTELKTCPFCDGEMRVGNYGETLRRLEIPSDDSFSISHVDEKLAIEKKCPLAIEFFNSREEAIDAWNRRVKPGDDKSLTDEEMEILNDMLALKRLAMIAGFEVE